MLKVLQNEKMKKIFDYKEQAVLLLLILQSMVITSLITQVYYCFLLKLIKINKDLLTMLFSNYDKYNKILRKICIIRKWLIIHRINLSKKAISINPY